MPVGLVTNCNPCGSTAAGTGLRNRSSGTITVTGVPAGATVTRAVLVWAVLIGNLWDTDVYEVGSVLPGGQTTLSLAHTQLQDCIGVGAAVLEVAQR